VHVSFLDRRGPLEYRLDILVQGRNFQLDTNKG
jgi:hypothetical protein